MRTPILPTAGLVAGLLLASTAPAQDDTSTRRAQAARHVLHQTVVLGMLRAECGQLLPDPQTGAHATARAWWERNRDDVVAARVWQERLLLASRQAGQQAFDTAVQESRSSATAAATQAAVEAFQRQRPDAASCGAALRSFAAAHLDAGAVAVLAGIRAEPGYRVPPNLRIDFETMVSFRPMASVEAAVAAHRRGDGALARNIYSALAERGDGQSAYAIGRMYLEADMIVRDNRRAYRWFYTAWLLGNLDGMYGLGAMLRDGSGTPRDPVLAFAAFHLAAAGATEPSIRALALSNAEMLTPSIGNQDRAMLACAPLGGFDLELRRRLSSDESMAGFQIAQAGRKLGQLAPALTGGQSLPCP